MLQELAGILDKKKPSAAANGEKPAPATMKPVAKVVAKKPSTETPPAVQSDPTSTAASETSTFQVGDRIRYKRGDDWIAGELKSTDPLVVAFDDHAVFHTTLDVLAAAVTKGTVQRV